MVPLVLVQNLTTRWRHQHWFQIWPIFNAIGIGSIFGHQVALLAISYKFGHQMAQFALVPKICHQMASFALVPNLATRWRHLHCLQIWPPDDAIFISSKFGHQMAPFVLVPNLVTRWRHMHLGSSINYVITFGGLGRP